MKKLLFFSLLWTMFAHNGCAQNIYAPRKINLYDSVANKNWLFFPSQMTQGADTLWPTYIHGHRAYFPDYRDTDAVANNWILTWITSDSQWHPEPINAGSITLNGDVTGAANNNTVVGIQGEPIQEPIHNGFFAYFDSTADTIKWTTPPGATIGWAGLYGNGIDGFVHWTGTNTVLGIVPVGGVYTLVRDIYTVEDTVGASATIATNGFIIYNRDNLIDSGDIENNGNNASGPVNGGATNPGSVGAGSQGGVGSTIPGTAGTPGDDQASGIGGSGGGGGTGGAVAGGTGGNALGVSPATGLPQAVPEIYGSSCRGGALVLYNGGAGGGSGGCGVAAGAQSGAGGGGAGVVMVASRHIYVYGTGKLEAKGGNGSAATGAGNNGGGAGGGGGNVFELYDDYTGNPATESGGLGGAGNGTGTAGANGIPGHTYFVKNVQ